jgi:hypothetical protein
MSEPDIYTAMQAGMSAENRRRELASQSPGLGALMSLPDVAYGPGVGISDVPLPPIGESYETTAAVMPQAKAYGPDRPVYADSLVGGLGYAPGGVQTALQAAGERVFAAQDRAAAGNAVEFVSPQAAPRPSLWARLTGRRRRR